MKTFAIVWIQAALGLGAPWGVTADPYTDARTYQIGQPRTALAAIEAQLRSASPQELWKIERNLLDLIQSPGATTDAKGWACRQLRHAGSEQSIPALAALLSDQALASDAQFALRSIASPKVDVALRDALSRTQGLLKAGVIQTLGARGDREAVPALGSLASQADPAIAEAALYALAHIGGADALQAVQTARVPENLARYRLHAVLLCAESLFKAGKPGEAAAAYQALLRDSTDQIIKAAALRGVVLTDQRAALPILLRQFEAGDMKLRGAAARYVCEDGDAGLLTAVFARFATLPTDVQALLFDLVNHPAALQAASTAARTGDDNVRIPAIEALGRLGDAATVSLLLGVAATDSGARQVAARRSLQRVPAPEADAALATFAESGDAPLRVEAMRALAGRGAKSAVPLLLRNATTDTTTVRTEALRAAATLADTPSLPVLVRILAECSIDAERSVAEDAAVAVSQRSLDKEAAATTFVQAMAGRDQTARCALLRALARVPSAKAADALRAATRDTDVKVRDVAVRGLADWPDSRPMPDLIEIARTAEQRPHRVLALRGFIRMAGLPSSRPAAETVKLFAQALDLAGTTADKRLVLSALSELKDRAALELALQNLASPDLDMEAASTVLQLANSLGRTDRDAAARAIRQVIETTRDPNVRQRAERAMVRVSTGNNIAPKGRATSPDGIDKDGASGGDQAAIDDNPATYWDEEDGKSLYRLVVTFPRPETLAALSIQGHQHHQYAPKDFEVICDGKSVACIVGASYDDNFLLIPLPENTCTTVELKITGYYGRSPAIRELGLYPPGSAADASRRQDQRP